MSMMTLLAEATQSFDDLYAAAASLVVLGVSTWLTRRLKLRKKSRPP